MADPLSIAASIAGLLMLATSVSKGIYEVVKAVKTPPPELCRLSDEIDAIIPILSELSSCTKQGSPGPQGWLLRHNFGGAVAGLKASLTGAEKMVHRFKHDNARKERLKRWRWVFEEQKVAEVVTCLQRQKVTLLLALSVVGIGRGFVTLLYIVEEATRSTPVWPTSPHKLLVWLANCIRTADRGLNRKSDQHVEDSLKGIDNNIGNGLMSVQQMQGVMQTVLLQILRQQTELGRQTSTFHQSVQQNINAVLLTVPKSDSPYPYPDYQNTEATCAKHDSCIATSTSTMYLKYFRYLASWGILEAAWGSLAFFEPPRPSGSRCGYGIRMTYIPPRWLLRMVLNLSLGLGIYPRLNVHFNIVIAAEVPYDAKIFPLALNGDLEGMKQLFRQGKAAATDRWLSGYTPLHAAAIRLDAEMCRFLLSEGADPAALWRHPFLDFVITPINNAQLFTPDLFENRINQQATFEALGYLGTQPPPIELEKKSWVQLTRPGHEFECAEGAFSMADLQTMDLHVRDKAGATLLHWACYLISGDLIPFLVEQGLNVNATDDFGRTALHDSCLSGDRRGIDELLNAGADWTLSDSWGQTPVDKAAESGHQDIWDSAIDSFLRARQQRLREDRATKARRGVEDIDYDTRLLFESLEEPVDAATLTPKEEKNITTVLEASQAEQLLHRFCHVLVFLVLFLAAVYLLLKIVECTRSL